MRSCTFRPIYKWFVFLLVIDVVVLGWCGANPPEGFFVPLARIGTIYYFFHFLILGLLNHFKQLIKHGSGTYCLFTFKPTSSNNFHPVFVIVLDNI